MKAVVLTISDGCYYGRKEDISGPALSKLLLSHHWNIAETRIVADEIATIQEQILCFSRQPEIDLIVTTGGTGLSPRDVTPEAVRPLLEKQAEGLAEFMRLRGLEATPFAALSRSLAGVREQTLILSLPGSLKGATQSLQVVLELLPHAVDLIQGRTQHQGKLGGDKSHI